MDHDGVGRLARRTGLSHDALAGLLADCGCTARGYAPPGCGPCSFRPSADQVEALLAAASDHPLGLAFLRDGELGAVAVTFRAHAFTVDAARRILAASDRDH